jgi:hypothetical protein
MAECHPIVMCEHSGIQQLEAILRKIISQIIDKVSESIEDQEQDELMKMPLCAHSFLIVTTTSGEYAELIQYILSCVESDLGEEAANSVQLIVSEQKFIAQWDNMISFSDGFFLIPPDEIDHDMERLAKILQSEMCLHWYTPLRTTKVCDATALPQ